MTFAGDIDAGPRADVLTLRLIAGLSYRYPALNKRNIDCIRLDNKDLIDQTNESYFQDEII